MKNAIELKNVVKKYDKFNLGPINLEIPSGVIVGLIGENGAGKTTMLKCILNILQNWDGSICIFDQDLKKQESRIKEDIGIVLDNAFFPELLNASDINKTMKGIYKNWDESLYFHYLKEFDLPQKKSIKTLSKGMRKKLEIATALSHHPKLLILDEPTSGLDPVVRSEVLDIFLKFIEDEDHTILLSTHITSDLEHVADHIIFLDQGMVVLDKDRDDIIDHYGIMKCNIEDFDKIEKEDILCYRKNKYDYQVLVSEKETMRRKYCDFIIDNITLEDLMVLIIKGVKPC